MLFVFPNLNVYSSLGSYTSSSQGLRANKRNEVIKPKGKRVPKNWAAVVGVAVGLGVGYVNHVADKYGVYDSIDNAFGNAYQRATDWNQASNKLSMPEIG